jgi:hypothetical protein
MPISPQPPQPGQPNSPLHPSRAGPKLLLDETKRPSGANPSFVHLPKMGKYTGLFNHLLGQHHVMRDLIVICLLGFALAGCTHAPPAGRDEALKVWRSVDATVPQRAKAVSRLFPVGTRIGEVRRVLGERGLWTRTYGLTGSRGDLRPTQWEDEWSLQYEFGNDGVIIEFKATNASFEACEFLGAEAFHRR